MVKESIPGTAAKILVVDDQAGMRLTLKGILSKRGYQVSMAEDGEQALEAVRNEDFKLILMDIKMPTMSGVETFVRIKALKPQVPVIMMTAFALEDDIRRAIREGAYTVMHKPFRIDMMLTLIDECLQDRSLILVVDDQSDVRGSLKMLLEMKGYRVFESDNGEDCLRKIEEKRYQIILLDVNLPGIDGMETLRRLKEVRPDVAVIMMSGYSVGEMTEQALREGSVAYLRKPIEIDNLVEKIDQNLKPGTQGLP